MKFRKHRPYGPDELFEALIALPADVQARERLWTYFGELGMDRAAELRWTAEAVDVCVTGTKISSRASLVVAAAELVHVLEASDVEPSSIWIACRTSNRDVVIELTWGKLLDLAAGRPIVIGVDNRVAWRAWLTRRWKRLFVK